MAGIYCLESVWDAKKPLSRRDSVATMLALLGHLANVRWARFDCGTRKELEHRLHSKNRDGYGVLYLALHGRAGRIWTEEEMLSLPALARMMGRRFRGWAVHLGSCKTFDIPAEQIEAFKRQIGARLVSGYSKDVYWRRDDEVLEFAWMFTLACGNKSLPAKLYGPLVEKQGLVVA